MGLFCWNQAESGPFLYFPYEPKPSKGGKGMQEIEIRCSNKRRTNSDREVRCNRFLGRMSVHSITIKCPRCGQLVLITKGPIGDFKFSNLQSDVHLISATKET